MKFIIWPAECGPFHGLTLEERPLGGIETAVIRLAEALQELGHDVYVASLHPNPPVTKPVYLSPQKIAKEGPFDVLIIARGWREFYLLFKHKIEYKKSFFWTGDDYTNYHTFGIGDHRVNKEIDGFLAVSEWQAKTISDSSGFPMDKIYVLRNGVKLSYFEGTEIRHRKRLIYSSTPYRGLIYLPEIYKELKRRHSELELYVYSSMGIYSTKWPPSTSFDDQYAKTFAELHALPDCHVMGNILQKDLSREFMKSAILSYPCNFLESSCITAMEAQAGGCAIVSSNIASLPETVGETGILVDGPIDQNDYKEKFIEACDRLLSDDNLFQKMSQTGLVRSQEFDWKKRAGSFLQYLKEKHGLS